MDVKARFLGRLTQRNVTGRCYFRSTSGNLGLALVEISRLGSSFGGCDPGFGGRVSWLVWKELRGNGMVFGRWNAGNYGHRMLMIRRYGRV